MTMPIEEELEEIQVETSVQDTQTDQKKESDEERNWKAFLEKRKEETKALEEEREKNKQLELERENYKKRIEEMKEAFKALLEKKEPNPYEYGNEEDPKKAIQEEVERLFREQEQKREDKERQERTYKETLAIKETMPDLMEVCSQENIAYLEYYHPEIAIPLGKMPDGFEKTKLAYQAIKKHVKMAKKEKERIEENLSKPKSMHAPYSNETQKEESSGNLSDKRKMEVWNKMQRLISGEDED